MSLPYSADETHEEKSKRGNVRKRGRWRRQSQEKDGGDDDRRNEVETWSRDLMEEKSGRDRQGAIKTPPTCSGQPSLRHGFLGAADGSVYTHTVGGSVHGLGL
ncbi:hypothetical protein DPEC_G00049170 [Dallia pectoralis]|uniref:Uncharacterized protein n=1 Tax=Dallia pectoralis TaxID=75939 RepID=A0ACC2HAQ8_DALPE|nr:hypothetical protein DPEC_G00049170 [Dallia pectoralis]